MSYPKKVIILPECKKAKLNSGFLDNSYNYFLSMNKQNKFIKEIRKAISEKQLVFYLQPKFKIGTCEIESAESLIRWNHPEKGWVMPHDFIAFAEKIDIIHEIDAWMLESVIKQIKYWMDNDFKPIKISVNISADSLLILNLYELLKEWIKEYQIDPSFMEIEITERKMIANDENIATMMKDIQNLGITLALDDFGTGYSSVLYLDKYQFDTIKLDRSFIRGVPHENKSKLITRSLIHLAHSLNLKVVAEGVENLLQFDFLEEMKCDIVQGYFFSKPIPVNEFEEKYLR